MYSFEFYSVQIMFNKYLSCKTFQQSTKHFNSKRMRSEVKTNVLNVFETNLRFFGIILLTKYYISLILRNILIIFRQKKIHWEIFIFLTNFFFLETIAISFFFFFMPSKIQALRLMYIEVIDLKKNKGYRYVSWLQILYEWWCNWHSIFHQEA